MSTLIHMKTPMLGSLFNKAAHLKACNFRLKHRCFPVNIAKFLKTPILRKICEDPFWNTYYLLILNSKVLSVILISIIHYPY